VQPGKSRLDDAVLDLCPALVVGLGRDAWKAARAEAKARAIAYPVDTGDGVVTVEVEPVIVITSDGVELREANERLPGLIRKGLEGLA
jgi:hypothetical protein